eukprot:TRINITY_DN9866_c0_g1_i2.p1 TRINITY_DN9866_c0_g1~~TRINITY_DN9866_c0_g1_i2.p1  ORF type:complete len:306 (-),score=99.38 TRINITY_DN9866_c0_g1_i2:109-1026(-)
MRQIKMYDTGVYPLVAVLVAYLTGAKRLVTAGKDKTVRVWDVERHECTHVFERHRGRVRALLVLDDTLYTASYDRTVLRWDLLRSRCAGEALRTTTAIHCGLFLHYAGGPVLVTGHRDGAILIHPFLTEEKRVNSDSCVELRHHTGTIRCMWPHLDFLITGSEDKSAMQWDLQTNEVARTYRRHVDAVVSVRTTADNLLFTASQDALIIMWNMTDGTFLTELHHHYHFVWTTELVMMRALQPPAPELDIPEDGVDPESTENTYDDDDDWTYGERDSDYAAYLITGSFDKTLALWRLTAASPEDAG